MIEYNSNQKTNTSEDSVKSSKTLFLLLKSGKADQGLHWDAHCNESLGKYYEWSHFLWISSTQDYLSKDVIIHKAS